MSHFYGNMQGSREETTRCGTKQSGLTAHVRGWDIGVSVTILQIDGKDVVKVYKTGGSNGCISELIATITEDQ